MKEFTGHALS